MTIMQIAFLAPLIVGAAGVVASALGFTRAACVTLAFVYLASSYLILTAKGAVPGTDGQGMMWGIMSVGPFWLLIAILALRKRTRAPSNGAVK